VLGYSLVRVTLLQTIILGGAEKGSGIIFVFLESRKSCGVLDALDKSCVFPVEMGTHGMQ
jgi:hypothetical protein